MEYQKLTNLLNDASNKQSHFRKRNWVEINDDIRGAYSPNKQIRFKTAMLRSSLSDYSGYSDGNIYLLKEINLLIILQLLIQIMEIRKQYLKIVIHLLTA